MFERSEIFTLNNIPTYAYLPIEFAERNGIKGITGPRNIWWEKKVDFATPLEYLSPSSRKKILKARQFAEEELGYKFELIEYLERKDFFEWIELYKRNLDKKEFGTPWIDESWYDREQEKLKYGAIIIRDKDNKIIAGTMMNRRIKSSKVSCDFRAHEYIKIKDSSLSALLEMQIDEYALKYNFQTITRGTDENIYGIRLNKGLVDFKKYYGFKPNALDTSSLYYRRVIVFFQELSDVMTFGYKEDGTLEEVIIEKTEVTNFESLYNQAG